ncbi:hypothetical protein CEN49_20110 [Fischerella thermalis CCMEE 5273]|nr:hypothetical protein CEN49_20110 [Fischerella thermalis CCMEE 5273]PMB49155.1 hypothetical protein CEN40_05745 [Fischerella thermalis CCMEE 5205]
MSHFYKADPDYGMRVKI